MKKMKRRSYKSTLLILLMTAILLIVSTYAWFTSNRTVTVEMIEVNVGAVNGLQISTNAVNWKSLITQTDILTGAYAGAVNGIPTDTLKPVSSALETDSTTGYMKMFYGVVEANASTGNYELTSTLLADADQKANGETPATQGYYIVFDMFLKVDADSPVYLTNASSVVGKTDADIARGLQNATRIAFVKEGHVGANESGATGLHGAQSVILWEPNNNVHTDSAITHASSTYNQTITASQVIASYPGLKAAFEDRLLTNCYPATPGTSDPFKTVSATIPTAANYASATTFVKFDDLTAGITKYRVYMWIEGQDFDCQNDASGSSMQFNLQFSLDNTRTGS